MAGEQSLQVLRVNHKEKVTEALESMFCDEKLCDVTICCSGQKVKAHRVVLAASSAYFKEIFAETLPGQYPIVFIKSITMDDLNAILEFIYKGEVTVPQRQMESLVTSAECLGVIGLGKLNLQEQEFLEQQQRSSTPAKSSVPNGSRGADQTSAESSSMVNTRNSSANTTEVEKTEPKEPKKRGKKRKKVDASEEVKSDKPLTNGTVNSSPQSTSSSASASSSTRRSSPPQSSSSTSTSNSKPRIVNGAHKASSPAVTKEPSAESEDTDSEQQSTSRSTRTNGNVGRTSRAHQEPANESGPSDCDMEMNDGKAGEVTSNGSLDLTRKSSSKVELEAGVTPQANGKPISKSRLRSGSQQITSQSDGGQSSDDQPAAKVPNLASIKNEISEQNSPPGPPASSSGPSTTLTTTNGATTSSAPATPVTTPTIFKPRTSSTTTTTPASEDIKPDLANIPPNIKIEARPRGRPRKAITANAAIVPRPLNPLLGLARSSLAAKVAAAAANKEASSSPNTASTASSTSAAASPVTPVVSAPLIVTPTGTPTTATESPSTPLVRISQPTPPPPTAAAKPTSTPIVTVVGTNGTVISTCQLPPGHSNGSASSPQVSPANSTGSASSSSSGQAADLTVTPPVVKKRRGRPPSSSLGLSNKQNQNQQEPRVPTLTLKLPNPLAQFLKNSLTPKLGTSSASSSSSNSMHPSIVSSPSSSSSSPPNIPSQHSPLTQSQGPAGPPSNGNAAATPPVTITSGSGGGGGGPSNGSNLQVPRFVPILPKPSQ